MEQKLDPKGKYLIQEGSGTIFVHTDKLAARKDMRPYNPATGNKVFEPNESTSGKKLVEIELQGKKFMVEQALYDVLVDMGEVMQKQAEELKPLQDECSRLEALNVRLDTDNTDLQEQLKKAQARILLIEGLVDPELLKEAEADQAAPETHKSGKKEKK